MQKPGITGRIYFIPAGCLLFILFFTVFGERGLLRINDLKRELNQINTRSAELREANAKLAQEIALLHNDRRYLERRARKDLGLVRPNEIIYQFPAQQK